MGQLNEALCKVLCHNICVLIQEAQANNIIVELEKMHINSGRCTLIRFQKSRMVNLYAKPEAMIAF